MNELMKGWKDKWMNEWKDELYTCAWSGINAQGYRGVLQFEHFWKEIKKLNSVI